MEAAFEKLKSQGKNTVDGIVQWMKDKNVLEEKKSEEQFKTNLNCTDQVDYDSFKNAVAKLSKEQQKTLKNMAEDLISAASSVDEYFAKMKREGKNSVDNLVKWMADSIVPIQEPAPPQDDDYFAKIISTAKEAEEKARKLFEGTDAKNVDLPKFKEAIAKIAEEQKKTVEDLTKTLKFMVRRHLTSSVDEVFAEMKKKGKNDVDNLVKWMADSKIIGTAREEEEKARKLFEGSDVKNVELPKFKAAIAKIAEEQKKSVEDLTKTLAEQAPKYMDALAAGVSAFKDALTKK